MGLVGLKVFTHVVHPFGATCRKPLALANALIENPVPVLIRRVVDVMRPEGAPHAIAVDTIGGASVVNAATEEQGGNGVEDDGLRGVGHCSVPSVWGLSF